MKAAVLYRSDRPLVLEERPDPAPGPTEVVIRVQRCGICGSDLHANQGPVREMPGGMVMGHEFAGEIVETGAEVTGLRKGQLIAVYPSTGCGTCPACRTGNVNLCPQGAHIMGGYAEYASIPASVAVPLDEGLSAAHGALIEPLTVGLYGVRLAQIGPGDSVLVLGAGSVALAAVYWARRLGAGRIVVLSRSDRRAAMALAMGADAFLRYGDDECAEAAEVLAGAPDIVLECVGTPGMLGKAIDHCRPFGKVLSLGFCTLPDPIVPAVAGFKSATLQFPTGHTPADFRHVARTMRSGHVDPAMMITAVIPLADVPARFAAMLEVNADTKVQIAPVAG